ncbi:MAG: molybdenum cofactor guanylyltransferase [Gaiellales bacterium]
MDRTAGIVLAGGRSARMGRAKIELPWNGRPLLALVVEVVAIAVDGPVVLVRAPGQVLPTLPAGVEVVEDARPARGPLEGMAAGLRAVEGRAAAVFLSAADVPFLVPELVHRLLGAFDGEAEAAVPVVGGQSYPLSAAYRLDVLPTVERRLAQNELRMRALLDDLDVRWLDECTLLSDPALHAADPKLDSLRNVNTPAEYEEALAYANAIRSG